MSETINYNLHNNMLIIGKASTNYGLLDIFYWNNPDAVADAYGKNSNITKAFNEAYSIGVQDIFMMNVQKKRDYLEIIDIIKQNDFSYIVLTDLFLTDTFDDVTNAEKIHNYLAYILGSIGLDHESVFFVTDKHASLFENIDDYIGYMNAGIKSFKSMCSGKANKENIVVVANNLKNKEFANVTLASVVCTTPVNKYPTYDYGEPIFFIDSSDNPADYAYFKNQTVVNTTVENLLNCRNGGAEKVFPVSRILKYIKRSIDYTEFNGRFYSSQIKLRINKKIDSILNSMVRTIINDYEILDVVAYKGDPGTVNIVCYLDVKPAFCFETCRIEQEVVI